MPTPRPIIGEENQACWGRSPLLRRNLATGLWNPWITLDAVGKEDGEWVGGRPGLSTRISSASPADQTTHKSTCHSAQKECADSLLGGQLGGSRDAPLGTSAILGPG